MKILIHATNLKIGGGITVVMNFLNTIIQNSDFHQHQYFLLAPSGIGYEEYCRSPIQMVNIPKALENPFKRLWLDYTWLDKEIRKINPDVIFTMGNFAIPTQYKQAVVFMYPYAIYPKEDKVWNLLDLKSRIGFRLRNIIFRKRLKYADIYFPQTETGEKRLKLYYGNDIKSTKVIPTAYSKLNDNNAPKYFFNTESNSKYLLTLTKYYTHKNLEILIDVAKIIRSNDSPIKVILTIDINQIAQARQLIESIKREGLQEILINIGHVNINSVPSLYNNVDGLLLPTLLESFSATYVDSLTMQKPIFTSDRDFARDVCGDAAFYFDPHNPEDIHRVIVEAFKDESSLSSKIKLGLERANSFPDWYQVTKMYITELEKLAIL